LTKPEVAVVMGSKSDMPVMERTCGMLERLGITYRVLVLSAHRTPGKTRDFARSAARRGTKVIIAGAGMAAHLAGAIASETAVPVIGVPLPGSHLNGVDALYSMVQMPSGVPVATMAIGPAGATNAAVFAAEILALADPAVKKRLAAYRRSLAGK
jgi:phosphoribosylaminoimidazole carboxylase PurE protein